MTGVPASCDAAWARAAPSPPGARAGRLVLATTILASSLAFIDGSVINVGLAAIRKNLHGDAADLQWVINAYLLPLSALILFGGAAGDRFGRRRLLLLGLTLFSAASLAAALAPGLGWLLAGRAAQGLGAAILLPNSLAVLGGAFEGEAKGRAVGLWAAASSMMGAAGPVLGGWLIDLSGWRSIFLINLPIGAAALLMAWRFVREPAPDAASRPPLDVAGAALATAGLAGLTYGLTAGSGGRGWTAGPAGALAAGLALLVAFVWVEKRRGDRAMMPLALFGSRSFIALTGLTFLLYGAFGGLLVLLPYALIESAGYSATAAGAALLPVSLLIAVASPMMGGLAERVGPRLPLTIGPLLAAAGLFIAARAGVEGGYWRSVFPGLLVIALGMATAVAPLTTAVLEAVDARHVGSASGLNSAAARLGGMVATALLGAALARHGPALSAAFRVVAVAGALACAAAAVGGLAAGPSRNSKARPR